MTTSTGVFIPNSILRNKKLSAATKLVYGYMRYREAKGSPGWLTDVDGKMVVLKVAGDLSGRTGVVIPKNILSSGVPPIVKLVFGRLLCLRQTKQTSGSELGDLSVSLGTNVKTIERALGVIKTTPVLLNELGGVL